MIESYKELSLTSELSENRPEAFMIKLGFLVDEFADADTNDRLNILKCIELLAFNYKCSMLLLDGPFTELEINNAKSNPYHQHGSCPYCYER